MDTPIVVGDNQSSDAFGRLRVSSPVAQFEYQNQYGSGDLIWNTKVTWTGTYMHQPNPYCVLLSTGTTVTGGEIIASGYCMAGSGTVRGLSGRQISSQYPLSLDIDGSNPANISLVCTSFSGTATVSAAINVKEFY